MFSIPPSVAINWPLPSEHPLTRGPELWIMSAIFLFATTLCVGVRLWTRIFIRRWVGLDDVLIVLAFSFSVCVTALAAVGTHKYDWDKHVWEMTYSHIAPGTKLLYFARICWGLSSSLVRLSVLCLYYRLADSCRAPKTFYRVLHATTIFNVTLLIYYFLSGVLPCFPVRAYWTFPALPGARCLNDGLSMEVSAIVNTLVEIWIASMPLIAVFKLRVKSSQRMSVISVLCLGYFVGIAGMARTYYIFKAFESYDITWWSSPQWICSEVEIDLALMCACMAPIRPVAGQVRSKLFGSRAKSKPVKHTDSTNPMLGNRKASTISQDCEAIQEWNTAITHHIDLEGISTEGYGYTVTITGPASNPQPRRRFPKFSSFRQGNDMLQRSKTAKSGFDQHGPTKITEYSVSESFETPGIQARPNYWQSLDADSSHVRPENMEFLTGFGESPDEKVDMSHPLGHTIVHSMSHEMEKEISPGYFDRSRTDTNNAPVLRQFGPSAGCHDVFESMDEDIEALPQLPSPTYRESRRPTSTVSSFRNTFHTRTKSKGSKG